MDSKGNIHELTDAQRKILDELKENVVPIPDDELDLLKAADLDARLKWYEERAHNAAPEGLSEDDARKVKNALKRERREREGK